MVVKTHLKKPSIVPRPSSGKGAALAGARSGGGKGAGKAVLLQKIAALCQEHGYDSIEEVLGGNAGPQVHYRQPQQPSFAPPFHMNKGKGGFGKSAPAVGSFKLDDSGGELGDFSGTIKSFGAHKNYGFIECVELLEYGDVFLHGDMKGGFNPGQVVDFTCVLNKDGKPVAINVRGAGGAASFVGSQPRQPSLTQGPSGPQRQQFQAGAGAGTFQIDNSGGDLGEFNGTIKRFGYEKNYGFIHCEELAPEYGDVFLHGDMRGDFEPGQTVTFTGIVNKDGKAVAIDLRVPESADI